MIGGTLTATQDEGAELARLRDRYDGLLDQPPAEVSREAQTDLEAMARIFDLDADRLPAEVWRDLRAVLIRQACPDLSDDVAPIARRGSEVRHRS